MNEPSSPPRMIKKAHRVALLMPEALLLRLDVFAQARSQWRGQLIRQIVLEWLNEKEQLPTGPEKKVEEK